jgi:hypothetical protein
MGDLIVAVDAAAVGSMAGYFHRSGATGRPATR